MRVSWVCDVHRECTYVQRNVRRGLNGFKYRTFRKQYDYAYKLTRRSLCRMVNLWNLHRRIIGYKIKHSVKLAVGLKRAWWMRHNEWKLVRSIQRWTLYPAGSKLPPNFYIYVCIDREINCFFFPRFSYCFRCAACSALSSLFEIYLYWFAFEVNEN